LPEKNSIGVREVRGEEERGEGPREGSRLSKKRPSKRQVSIPDLARSSGGREDKKIPIAVSEGSTGREKKGRKRNDKRGRKTKEDHSPLRRGAMTMKEKSLQRIHSVERTSPRPLLHLY